MKIPRRRQNPHITRMADFLRRHVWMLAAIVLQRLRIHIHRRQRTFPDQRVIRKLHQIA